MSIVPELVTGEFVTLYIAAVLVSANPTLVTDPDEAVVQAGIPPTTVNTCPVVPIPNLAATLVDASYAISPVVVIGVRALNAAAAVV
jgi:hypothetical protein